MQKIILLIIMFIVDIIQYDFILNSNIYILLLVLWSIYCLLTNKTFSNFLFVSFIIFLSFTDITREIRSGNEFNSIYFGKMKYFFYLILIGVALCKEKVSRRGVILVILGSIYGIVTLFKRNLPFQIFIDIVYYINIFCLPYLISILLNKREARKILKVYDSFVYILPVFISSMLIIGRFSVYISYKYVILGGIIIMNIAYLVGKNTEKIYRKDLFFILYYIFLYKFGIGSGEILLLCFLVIYFIFNRIDSSFWIKFLFLVIFVLLFYFGLRIILKEIIEGNYIDNVFFKYKLYQIYKLIEFSSITDLPFSVRVRVGSMINIFYTNLGLDIFFGQGFGGGYKDISKIFSTLDLDITAFSVDEIKKGVFYRSHFVLFNFYLKYGIIGIFFLSKEIIENIKKLKKYFPSYIPVYICLIYVSYYGIKSIIIWSFLLGAIMCLNKTKGEIGKNDSLRFMG